MPRSDHKRSTRVAQLLQEELAGLLINEIKDPRVGLVTVTEVRLADDLSFARVFVSVYGDDAQREAALAGLRGAAGFLRRELAHRVKLRHMPELAFSLDETLDQAERLETVFNAIQRGETEVPTDQHLPLVPVHTQRDTLPLNEPVSMPKAPRSKRHGRRPRSGSSGRRGRS